MLAATFQEEVQFLIVLQNPCTVTSACPCSGYENMVVNHKWSATRGRPYDRTFAGDSVKESKENPMALRFVMTD
jgi:hypothetical protein